LAGRTRKEAHDAFLGPFRRAVQCVAAAEVFTSGYAGDDVHVVACTPHFPEQRNWGAETDLPLVAETGEHDLFFRVNHQYTVVHEPNDQDRGPYKISSAHYGYGVFDRDGRELLVYQWHPRGISSVRYPHLHVSCAPIVQLPLRGESQPREIVVSNLHLPTSRILLEDVIELLIRELKIRPLRDDWERVLRANRAAVRPGSTWSWWIEEINQEKDADVP
jgi:hypothetical protein